MAHRRRPGWRDGLEPAVASRRHDGQALRMPPITGLRQHACSTAVRRDGCSWRVRMRVHSRVLRPGVARFMDACASTGVGRLRAGPARPASSGDRRAVAHVHAAARARACACARAGAGRSRELVLACLLALLLKPLAPTLRLIHEKLDHHVHGMNFAFHLAKILVQCRQREASVADAGTTATMVRGVARMRPCSGRLRGVRVVVVVLVVTAAARATARGATTSGTGSTVAAVRATGVVAVAVQAMAAMRGRTLERGTWRGRGRASRARRALLVLRLQLQLLLLLLWMAAVTAWERCGRRSRGAGRGVLPLMLLAPASGGTGLKLAVDQPRERRRRRRGGLRSGRRRPCISGDHRNACCCTSLATVLPFSLAGRATSNRRADGRGWRAAGRRLQWCRLQHAALAAAPAAARVGVDAGNGDGASDSNSRRSGRAAGCGCPSGVQCCNRLRQVSEPGSACNRDSNLRAGLLSVRVWLAARGATAAIAAAAGAVALATHVCGNASRMPCACRRRHDFAAAAVDTEPDHPVVVLSVVFCGTAAATGIAPHRATIGRLPMNGGAGTACCCSTRRRIDGVGRCCGLSRTAFTARMVSTGLRCMGMRSPSSTTGSGACSAHACNARLPKAAAHAVLSTIYGRNRARRSERDRRWRCSRRASRWRRAWRTCRRQKVRGHLHCVVADLPPLLQLHDLSQTRLQGGILVPSRNTLLATRWHRSAPSASARASSSSPKHGGRRTERAWTASCAAGLWFRAAHRQGKTSGGAAGRTSAACK